MARKKIYRKNSSNGLEDTNLVIPTSSDLQKLDGIESGAQKNPKLATVATSGSYNDLSNKPDLNAKADNHRHYRAGDSQRNAGVYTYFKLASFPIDNAGNSCSLTVDGRIGGWNNGNKGYLSMVISNRDGVAASGTLIGNADLSLCDLVVYTSGTISTNSTAILYAKTYSWFAFDLTLGPMQGVTDIWDDQGANTTPAGTLAWTLSGNANKFMQIRDNGSINAGADLAVNGKLDVGGAVTVGGNLTVGGKTVLTDHLSIKTLKTDNTASQATSASESIAGSGVINLHKVSKTGSYNDLNNKPTIPTVSNGTLTIQKNGSNVASFTANSSSNVTANITVPTKVSELVNDSGIVTENSLKTVNNTSLIGSGNITVGINKITYSGSGDTVNVIKLNTSTGELSVTRNGWSMSNWYVRSGSFSADNNQDHIVYSSSSTANGHGHGCLIMAHGHIVNQAGYINITDTSTFYTDYDSYAIQAGEEGYWGKSWVTATAYFEKDKTMYVHAKGVEGIYIISIYF